MMEFLRRTWEQITAFLRRMPLPNRVALVSLSAALVAVLVLFLTMSARDNKVPLVWEQIDLTQANNVRKKLDEKGTPYDIRGGRIFVEPEHRDSLLMELYGEGVISGDDKQLYEWVFQQDFTMTPGKRDLEWLVSREAALAKMISSLDPVESARVKLTQQREEWYSERTPMNAAVSVKLKPGKTLSDETVMGIARWVAFAVQDMKPQDVAIMDTAGTMYPVPDPNSDAADAVTIQKYIANLEKYFEEKLKRFLTPIYGSHLGVMARVIVDMDKEKRLKQGPDQPIETKIKNETLIVKGTSKGGEPGVVPESNGAQVTPYQPGAQGGGSSETEKTLKKQEVDQEFPTESVEKIKAVGTIKTISMVIAAPYERLLLLPNGKEAGVTIDKDGKETVNPAAQDKQVTTAVTDLKKELAAGLQLDQKDIEVIPATFAKPKEVPEPTPTQKTLWFLEQHWTKIGLVLLSLVALFLIWRVLRSAAPDEVTQELAKLRVDLKAAEPQIEEEVYVPVGEENTVAMKERIRDAVKRNPRNAANLLKRWITKG